MPNTLKKPAFYCLTLCQTGKKMVKLIKYMPIKAVSTAALINTLFHFDSSELG
jgi:hypothetical protein